MKPFAFVVLSVLSLLFSGVSKANEKDSSCSAILSYLMATKPPNTISGSQTDELTYTWHFASGTFIRVLHPMTAYADYCFPSTL